MSKIDPAVLAELVDALPDKVVVTDPDGLEKYRWDLSRDLSAVANEESPFAMEVARQLTGRIVQQVLGQLAEQSLIGAV